MRRNPHETSRPLVSMWRRVRTAVNWPFLLFWLAYLAAITAVAILAACTLTNREAQGIGDAIATTVTVLTGSPAAGTVAGSGWTWLATALGLTGAGYVHHRRRRRIRAERRAAHGSHGRPS